MDKYIQIIEKDFDNLKDKNYYNYAILAKDKFRDDSKKYVDVTLMFSTPNELKEVGITKKDRAIIAYNKNGYYELIDLGFNKNEIWELSKFENGEDS